MKPTMKMYMITLLVVLMLYLIPLGTFHALAWRATATPWDKGGSPTVTMTLEPSATITLTATSLPTATSTPVPPSITPTDTSIPPEEATPTVPPPLASKTATLPPTPGATWTWTPIVPEGTPTIGIPPTVEPQEGKSAELLPETGADSTFLVGSIASGLLFLFGLYLISFARRK